MNNQPTAPLSQSSLKSSEARESEEVSALRKWLDKRVHLPGMTERELRLFFRINDRMLEPTKTAIEAYYSVRASAPNLFANRDLYSRELRRVVNVFSMLPLGEKSRDGQSVMLFRLLEGDAGALGCDDCLKLGLMYLELWSRLRSGSAALILVIDSRGFGLSQVARLPTDRLRDFIRSAELGLPLRIRALHFINATAATDVLVNIVKPLITRKLDGGIHVHKTLDSLEEFVPVEALPFELGGKAGSLRILHEAQVRRLENHRDWFLNEEVRARVYQIGKFKKEGDIFGVENLMGGCGKVGFD